MTYLRSRREGSFLARGLRGEAISRSRSISHRKDTLVTQHAQGGVCLHLAPRRQLKALGLLVCRIEFRLACRVCLCGHGRLACTRCLLSNAVIVTVLIWIVASGRVGRCAKGDAVLGHKLRVAALCWPVQPSICSNARSSPRSLHTHCPQCNRMPPNC